jgi:hypothetical protein
VHLGQAHRLLCALSDARKALDQQQQQPTGKAAVKRAVKSWAALAKILEEQRNAAHAFQTPSARKMSTGARVARQGSRTPLLDMSPQTLLFIPNGTAQKVSIA